MIENPSFLITGGTGSFGRQFLKLTLERFNPRRIIVYSRDEMKQWEMSNWLGPDPRVRFFIGDVRDRDRLYRAMHGIDYVIHAAATKIVPVAEYNPFECIKTNVLGAVNVIDAAIDSGVSKVIALSTDKASAPANLYGASKLASDKLFTAANSSYAGGHSTAFAVVRYGNVMGSRGSIIPFFLGIKHNGTVPVTDPTMTRFMISLREAVELVWFSFDDCVGGETYIKKIPSMRLSDIVKAVAPAANVKIIGQRPGEKKHEQMIGIEDAPYTYEYDGYYKILPQINDWYLDEKRIKNGVRVQEGFCYRSDNNSEWLSVAELEDWISKNTEFIYRENLFHPK